MGAAINNIVVDDNFVSQKKFISFLKKKKLGKVTMLPLENLKPSKPDLSGELFADTVVKTGESIALRQVICLEEPFFVPILTVRLPPQKNIIFVIKLLLWTEIFLMQEDPLREVSLCTEQSFDQPKSS